MKKPNNSPNQAIVIVDTLLGASTLITNGLEKLHVLAISTEQQQAVKDAEEQADIFQRVDLSKLREVFE